MSGFLTVSQLANRWALDPRTIRRKIASKDIPVTNLVGSLRIPVEGIEVYERQQTRKAK